jgi:hypothetical protein
MADLVQLSIILNQPFGKHFYDLRSVGIFGQLSLVIELDATIRQTSGTVTNSETRATS